jgi:uncharacterized membrane protein (DUF2068 family)
MVRESSKADEEMMPTQQLGDRPAGVHDRGLLLIGIFKLAKAIFFFCLGAGAVHLLHKESRLVALLLHKADLIDAHRLRQISVGTFGYSALALTEGIGLLLEKVWAEYLTLILTVSFLPWELYELVRKPDWFRLSLLIINLAVLAYLVWLLRRKNLLGKR